MAKQKLEPCISHESLPYPGAQASCLQGERDARDPIGVRESPPQNQNNSQHKFWYSRGYLPHCDTPGLLQAITFRLADSLPSDVLDGLLQEALDDVEKHNRIEALLDTGHGKCWLRQAKIAQIVEDALLHDDGQHYRLLAWCVMPNHVHVLIETREGWPLKDILHSWKSFTAKSINHSLGHTGTVWMPEYFDRYIRNDHHLAAVIAYIHANPVKAGLVQNAGEWPYSSAKLGSADVSPANNGSAGILPANNGNADVSPANNGSAGILPANNGNAGILPANAGVTPALPGYFR